MAAMKIIYYTEPSGRSPVDNFINSLPTNSRTKVYGLLEAIKIYGLTIAIRHLRKMHGSCLWEIRLLGKDKVRIFYVVQDKNIIILLHGFLKRSQKTPVKEIATALRRYYLLLQNDII
jgi:phage-related protein